MTIAASPELRLASTAGPEPAAQRQVMVVVDPCCEIDPAAIAALEVLVLPRTVRAGGRSVTLGPDQTLHHGCWPQPPRSIAPQPYALGELAQAYERVLRGGLSVLALHLPSRLDPTSRGALAARSILLAGQSYRAGCAPRIAVYELPAVGSSFAFLVEVAARAAMEGMTLQQVLTLLDRLQIALRGHYLTGLMGPHAALRHRGRSPGVARVGSEQLWELDRASGQFACRARGWSLAGKLFRPHGLLAGLEPTAVCVWNSRLLDRVNAGRAQAQLPPLAAQPGGLSLAPLFPRGCVELAMLADQAQIIHIIDVIRRIDRPAPPSLGGVRRRGERVLWP